MVARSERKDVVPFYLVSPKIRRLFQDGRPASAMARPNEIRVSAQPDCEIRVALSYNPGDAKVS
jgi:hypothetical protein